MEAEAAAKYYDVPLERVRTLIEQIESSDHPEIFLLQKTPVEGEVSAVCFVSSVWSHSYQSRRPIWVHHHNKVTKRAARVYRDFYYQCLFSSMQLLCSIGCDTIRVRNLMSGYKWSWDEIVCLYQAQQSIFNQVKSDMVIGLFEDEYETKEVEKAEEYFRKISPIDHRPIAIHLYVQDATNIARIFVEIRA